MKWLFTEAQLPYFHPDSNIKQFTIGNNNTEINNKKDAEDALAVEYLTYAITHPVLSRLVIKDDRFEDNQGNAIISGKAFYKSLMKNNDVTPYDCNDLDMHGMTTVIKYGNIIDHINSTNSNMTMKKLKEMYDDLYKNDANNPYDDSIPVLK